MRLGWIADYFSEAVLVGYISGVAIVLIVGQFGKMMGIATESHNAVAKLTDLFTSLDETQALTLAIGLSTLLLLVLVPRLVPKVPAALMVVVASIGLSWAFDFAGHGVSVVGSVPAGLPHFSIPDVGVAEIRSLVAPALGIFIVGFADSILTARSFAMRHR
jgi:MFS superfamily sulfate permease-like transporter